MNGRNKEIERKLKFRITFLLGNLINNIVDNDELDNKWNVFVINMSLSVLASILFVTNTISLPRNILSSFQCTFYLCFITLLFDLRERAMSA